MTGTGFICVVTAFILDGPGSLGFGTLFIRRFILRNNKRCKALEYVTMKMFKALFDCSLFLIFFFLMEIFWQSY
jgi:hypothetical protein